MSHAQTSLVQRLLLSAAGGAALTAAVVAFALRPAALAPRASAATDAVAPSPLPSAAPHAAGAVVYVVGAVVRPGLYTLPASARAFDAVTKAGGLAHDADAAAVNLAARVNDGDEIAVPHVGEPLRAPRAAGRHAAKRGGHHRRRHVPRRPTPDEDASLPRIDVNRADESALATVPGIGATLASRIVEFRTVNGPFTSVDGLADVAGISPTRFDAIAPFVTVGRE